MDLQIYRGDRVTLNIAVTLAGSAFDLTNCSLWMTAKYQFDDLDASAVFQKTLSSGIVVTSATGGLATITIASDDTEDLANTKVALVYDVQLKDANGAIYTVAYGALTVLPDVTRAVS